MASAVPFMSSPYTFTYSKIKQQFHVRVQCLGGRESVVSSDSIRKHDKTCTRQQEKNANLINGGTAEQEEDKVVIDQGLRRLKPRIDKNWIKDDLTKVLEPMWNDGYGTKTVKDFLVGAREIIVPDGGPPRWFCPVECGQPLKNSPVLLFLPGLDGVGLGLTLHHKSLGKVFEAQCLHIPFHDRTSFEGLVKLVEEAVRLQHALSPNKPVYLVGESLGGCLALSVAARNPKIDLVVVLINPGTSFERSQLQGLIPVLEVLPEGLCNTVPYLLSSIVGNPLKMAMANIRSRHPPKYTIERFLANLIDFQTYISDIINSIPIETFLWKFKLLKSAAADANSHLHAVKAEVLVLASGNDNVLPSRHEAQRLQNSLQNCTVRLFKENGHALLLVGRRCQFTHNYQSFWQIPSFKEA